MSAKYININLNQTVSRFEMMELQKEKNRWYIFSALVISFLIILILNLFLLNRYNNLISSRLDKANSLIQDAQKIRQKYESYDVDVSISQDDIDKLHKIESDRISLANKLQVLSRIIPDEMSLFQLEYDYIKKEMILTLTSDTNNDNYEKNISLLKNNLVSFKTIESENGNENFGIFGDSNFKHYEFKKEKDNHKQQEYYKVILTLSKK